MPRDVLSITIDDVSMFTKSLRNNLIRLEGTPSHSQLLGVVAKAAGYDNFQHLKANKPSAQKDHGSKVLNKALRTFNDQGIMTYWPKQTNVQALCMWAFWARLPARTDIAEQDVNAILKSGSRFGDHVLLRRSLIDHRLAERATDGSTYRRIEQAPPPDARELIASVQRPS